MWTWDISLIQKFNSGGSLKQIHKSKYKSSHNPSFKPQETMSILIRDKEFGLGCQYNRYNIIVRNLHFQCYFFHKNDFLQDMYISLKFPGFSTPNFLNIQGNIVIVRIFTHAISSVVLGTQICLGQTFYPPQQAWLPCLNKIMGYFLEPVCALCLSLATYLNYYYNILQFCCALSLSLAEL